MNNLETIQASSDYCGHSIGFRVSETKKTVQVIWKVGEKWLTCGEPMRYPMNNDAIPTAPPVANVSLWQLAWAVLDHEEAEKAGQLRKMLTVTGQN